jgi:hypothetical protein
MVNCQRTGTVSQCRNGSGRQVARNPRESRRAARGREIASVATRMRWLVLVGLAACSYTPGSYAFHGRSFPGQRVTLGCLDVSIDRRLDMEGRPVLDYQFGNRCDSSIVVDLARVPVVGRTTTGDEVALAAWDPNDEISAARLGARQAGGEALAYETPAKDGKAFAQVCVDAAALVAQREANWICFASRPATLAEVTR